MSCLGNALALVWKEDERGRRREDGEEETRSGRGKDWQCEEGIAVGGMRLEKCDSRKKVARVSSGLDILFPYFFFF